jgi:F-type H+-transporting ATPase subunit b
MSAWLANFLFEMLNFLVLVGALGWLLFKPVRQALEAERTRHAHMEQELNQRGAETKALAEQTQAAWNSAHSEIERQRSEFLAAARKEAEQLREEAVRKLAAEREAMARDLAAARREQALALTETVGRMAGEAVQRLLASLDGPALDLALVRGACEEVRLWPSEARARAVVETARPLSSDGRRLLREALQSDFREVALVDLGAGVRITTPAGQVDASATALAREAVRAVIGADEHAQGLGHG